MNHEMRRLCMRALCKDPGALYALGVRLYYGCGCSQDRKLSQFCLRRAIEMGSEAAFFFYHSHYSKGKKVIDDKSYFEMLRSLQTEKKPAQRRRLKRYLSLGTRKQKQGSKLLVQSFHIGKG